MSDFDRAPTQDTSRSAEVAHTVQDKAAEGAGLVGEKATDVVGTAAGQAANTLNEATAQARNLLGELRGQVQDQSRAQARQLAGNVRRLADDLHEMSENGKPDSTATAVVRQVADSGRKVASHLENRGPEGIVEDLRDFARRKPGLFLAGAAVAGFAAARLGKGISAAGPAEGHGAGTRPGAPSDDRRTVGSASGPALPGAGGHASSDSVGTTAGVPDAADHPSVSQVPPPAPATPPVVPAYPPAAAPGQGRVQQPEGN